MSVVIASLYAFLLAVQPFNCLYGFNHLLHLVRPGIQLHTFQIGYEVDEECHERIESLAGQMKTSAGITEELKSTDFMQWIGLVNNVRNQNTQYNRLS